MKDMAKLTCLGWCYRRYIDKSEDLVVSVLPQQGKEWDLTIGALVETLGTTSDSDSIIGGKIPSLLRKTRVRSPGL
jgi:hypothetical protein